MGENLAQLWTTTRRRAPGAPAVIECASGLQFSRADLDRHAHATRDSLPDPHHLNGRRVVMAAPNGAAWLAMFIALLERGAIPAAVDPGEPAAASLATARAIRAAWLWDGATMKPVSPATRADRRGDRCLLKVTSGSTGTPRALVFTHAQMIADARQVCSTMGIRPDDSNLAVIPFGHSYGLGNIVIPLLTQGTAVICASGPLPRELATDCARWRPSVFPAVPALIRALALADLPRESLASLRTIISAGAPLPAAVADAFVEKYGKRVHGFYGSSETGGITYDRNGKATLSGRSVGTPLEGVSLHFTRGGRFTVESAAVMRSGRHRPADFARLDERGELVLLGRAGRTVKLAGRRLDLGEIEAILRAVPGVSEAFAMEHPTRPDSIAAAVSGEVQAAEVRAHLAKTVASWKIPHRLIVVDSWPLTPRGKTDTRRLRAMVTKG